MRRTSWFVFLSSLLTLLTAVEAGRGGRGRGGGGGGNNGSEGPSDSQNKGEPLPHFVSLSALARAAPSFSFFLRADNGVE